VSPHIVIFCICGIWLAIASLALTPPKEKWPIGFQASALLFLCCVWIATARWLLASYGALPGISRHDLGWTLKVVFFYMPLPIAVLGARFCWCFFRTECCRTTAARFLHTTVALVTLAILLLLVYWILMPKLQKVIDAVMQ